jgi:hypothetical protein
MKAPMPGALIARPGGGSTPAEDLEAFLEASLDLRFESRYFGEERWWVTTRDEVARSLAPYHPDLGECLERMVEGEEVSSPLSAFRIARPAVRAASRRPA